MGSQDNILYNDEIKKKFKVEFNSKLARRSFFVFVKEECVLPSYTSIEELIEEERLIEDKAIQSRLEVSEYITDLTKYLVSISGSKTISVNEKVRNLFYLYKRYNEEIASTIDSQFYMTKLTRAHLQWKALKLAGAFAIINGNEEITEDDYKGAIQYIELINNDILVFEKELVKEPYELFADYCRLYAVDKEYSINLHNLRKCGFIPMKQASDFSMKELVKLVSSYDEHGIYKLDKDTIHFSELEKTDKIYLSYLKCIGTKQERAKKCNTGFECVEVTFKCLGDMLLDDYAYSPFKFTNGIRGKDNIESGCKWIVLDIDKSDITDEEAHILLNDLNHYIVRTSQKDNPNKFRILLELDAEVHIQDIDWKEFISAITKDLGLIADPLPKSQIFFSYSDRTVYSQLEGSTIVSKPFIDLIHSQVKADKKKPTKANCKALLDDPINTFDRAFNCQDGEGSRKLIWSARLAKELGADKEYTIKLMKQINNYWISKMDEDRFNSTIISQISRWSW
jgi:hypothetical protein